MNDELDSLRETIDSLSPMRDLIRSPGWKILTDHFTQVIQAVSDRLDIEEDYNEIRRLQERKRAFKSIFEAATALCQEHSEAIARLQEMENINQESEQYDLES